MPEGHSSCVLWETTSEDQKSVDVGIAFVGGARHTEPSTWELGNSLTIFQCFVYEDDVEVKNCVVITAEKMRGSTLYPLQGSSMVNVFDIENSSNEEYSIFIWGGGCLNTKTITCTSELVQLNVLKNGKTKRTRTATKRRNVNNEELKIPSFSVDATVFAGLEARVSGNSQRNHQTGATPSARTGHSLTMVSDHCAVLFGGVEMEQRDKGVFTQQTCKDGELYILDVKEKNWSCLASNTGGKLLARAYHTAVFGSTNKTLFIIGGVQLEINTVQYCNVGKIITIKFEPNFISFTHEVINITLSAPLFLSSHASCLSDNIIYIFGGYQSKEEITAIKPETSKTMLLIDVEHKVALKKDAGKKHATAGLSLVKLSNLAFLICGGTNKEILLFTSVMPAADKCDLNDKCIINTTGVTFPIPGLKCDGICKRWIHLACTGLTIIPKDKYICKDCKGSRRV